MSQTPAASSSRSLRESFAALPGWAKIIVSLVLANLGFAVAFMVMWLIGAIVLVIPWVLMAGVAMVQPLAQ